VQREISKYENQYKVVMQLLHLKDYRDLLNTARIYCVIASVQLKYYSLKPDRGRSTGRLKIDSDQGVEAEKL
jgi:hypothetical protein